MPFLNKPDTRDWEILILRTKLITTEVKRSTRESLLINFTNFNLLTKIFFFGFPIMFYFSCLGATKKSELNELIKLSLPGFAKQENILSWETFQKTNFLPIPENSANISLTVDSLDQNLNQQNQFQKFIYQNSISNLLVWGQSLEFRLNNDWQSYKKQSFLGLKVHSTGLNKQKYFIYPSRDKLDSTYYKNLYTNQTPNLQTVRFYQLDQYPLKVENNYNLKSFAKLPIERKIINTIISESVIDKNTLLSQFHRGDRNLIGIKTGLQHLQSGPNSTLNIIKKDIALNLAKYNQAGIKWQLLTTRIKAIQNQTNYNLTFHLVKAPNSESIKFINNKFNLLASHQLLTLLNQNVPNNLNSLNLKGELNVTMNRSPLMSGFFCPDISKNILLGYHFGKANFFMNRTLSQFENQAKIYLGSHFAYPEFNWNKLKDPLSFSLQYHPVSFEMRNGKIRYKGPGVVFNDAYKTNSVVTGNFLPETQRALKTTLNRPDPRYSQPFYSFANVLSEIRLKRPTSQGLNQLYESAKQKSLLKNYLTMKPSSKDRSAVNPAFHYKSEFVVPYFNKDAWQNWLLKKKFPIKSEKSLIQSFPLRKIQYLIGSDSKIIYDSVDYQNSTWLFKFLNTNIYDCEELLDPSSFLKPNGVGKYQNIIYQNKRNLYKSEINKQNSSPENKLSVSQKLAKMEPTVFREVWEPIHQNSWLTINKFFFALLVVYILKQFTHEYGKELVLYLVDFFASAGIVDESLKEELAPQTVSETYRLITKSKKDFNNITGINHIFNDIAEVVWSLRNSGRPLKLGAFVPQGLLLVGAPGTGKTLLVQSIAGEADVPVLVQSASTLHRLEGRGPQKLQRLFEKARELGPCIIFFDELDSIGEKRSKIIENPIDQTTLLSLLYWNGKQKKQIYDYDIPFPKKKTQFTFKKLNDPTSEENNIEMPSNSQDQSPAQLGLLMQLLIELDGLQVNQNLVVIGATNRPEILDPALTRPGRLSKTLEIGLPNKESRIRICQLYSRFLGVSKNICWNIVAEETKGLSGADLATIVNQSSIQAILAGTKHTQETMNIAISKVLGLGGNLSNSSTSITDVFCLTESKLTKNNLQKHFLVCSAYNEAGLKVLEYLLPHYQNPIIAKLISVNQNPRYKNQNLDFFIKTQQLTTQYKIQFRTKILALLAGKAAESLLLKRSKLVKWDRFRTLLNLGTHQLNNVSRLIYFTISKEAFFPSSAPFLNFALLENQNFSEQIDRQMIDLFTTLSSEYEKDLLTIEFSKYRTFQRWTTKSWWQLQVSNLDKLQNTKKSSWYRLFVMHPDNSTASDERLSADNYFHSNQAYFLTRTLSFNGKFQQRRDLLYRQILMNSFILTSKILKSNLEVLDLLAVSLIQKRTITETELNNLFINFNKDTNLYFELKFHYVNQLNKNTVLNCL